MLLPFRKLRSLAGALLGTCGLFLAAQTPAPAPAPAPATAWVPTPHKAKPVRPAKPKPAKVALIDVNSAPKATLMTLPGIDSAAADKIIAGRPYVSKARLVTGNILPMATFQAIRARIVAANAAAALKHAPKK